MSKTMTKHCPVCGQQMELDARYGESVTAYHFACVYRSLEESRSKDRTSQEDLDHYYKSNAH